MLKKIINWFKQEFQKSEVTETSPDIASFPNPWSQKHFDFGKQSEIIQKDIGLAKILIDNAEVDDNE